VPHPLSGHTTTIGCVKWLPANVSFHPSGQHLGRVELQTVFLQQEESYSDLGPVCEQAGGFVHVLDHHPHYHLVDEDTLELIEG
jgi:hypothetical protein